MEKENDGKIKYIENFTLIPKKDKYCGWEEDVYIRDNEIYNKDNVLIARTDDNGEIIFEETYLEYLENLITEKFNGLMDFDELGLKENRKINLQELLEENDKQIVELSEEELEEQLLIQGNEEGIEEVEENVINDEESIEPEENIEDKADEFSEEELIESGHGWEEFSHLIKVKETDKIYEDFPDLEKPLIFGYDKSGNFTAITIGENGEPVPSQIISGARSTMKEVIHIDDKGDEVNEMVPTAVMDTRNDNLKISIKIGQYGYPEAQKIQITHDNHWIATNIDKEGSHDKVYDVEYATDPTKQGECGNEEVVENYELHEEAGDNNIELEEVEHGSTENLESVKRQVVDDALENYNEMSSEELYNYIKDELREKLGNDDFDIDEIAEEVKETVEDESRFPTRGERG